MSVRGFLLSFCCFRVVVVVELETRPDRLNKRVFPPLPLISLPIGNIFLVALDPSPSGYWASRVPSRFFSSSLASQVLLRFGLASNACAFPCLILCEHLSRFLLLCVHKSKFTFYFIAPSAVYPLRTAPNRISGFSELRYLSTRPHYRLHQYAYQSQTNTVIVTD